MSKSSNLLHSTTVSQKTIQSKRIHLLNLVREEYNLPQLHAPGNDLVNAISECQSVNMSPERRLEDMNNMSPRKFNSESHRNYELTLSYVRDQEDLSYYLQNRRISFAVLDKYCSVEQGDLLEIKNKGTMHLNVLTPQRETSPLDRLYQDNIKTSQKRRSFKKKRSGKTRTNRKTK